VLPEWLHKSNDCMSYIHRTDGPSKPGPPARLAAGRSCGSTAEAVLTCRASLAGWRVLGLMQSVAAFSIPRHWCAASETMTDRFEDIRTFITVVQAKGFAGAGERLGVAKSGDQSARQRPGRQARHPSSAPDDKGGQPTVGGRRFLRPRNQAARRFGGGRGLCFEGTKQSCRQVRVTAPVSFGISLHVPSAGRVVCALSPGFRFKWSFSTATPTW